MTSPQATAAFLCQAPANIDRAYDPAAKARLESLARLLPGVLGAGDLAAAREADYLFSAWGMPAWDEAAWRSLTNLKAVFYAAGSVQAFARPLLGEGVRLFSAWEANAQPVAEYCLAQILLAGKSFLPLSRDLARRGPQAWSTRGIAGNRGSRVALLGAGSVGRALIQRLKPFALQVLVFDPFLDPAEAARLDVEKVSLEQAFDRATVVSNHLADLPATRGLLGEALLGRLRPGATFINTGRGATVDQEALWRVLARRPDLCAVLDVAEPEPPPEGSPAYRLPNVFLSPHSAGSLGNEIPAMGAAVLDSFEALLGGDAPKGEITLTMLETMA